MMAFFNSIDWASIGFIAVLSIFLIALAWILSFLPWPTGLFNRCYDSGLKIMQFPAYAFDLTDNNGFPDHGKIVPFIVVMTWNFGLVIEMILSRSWPPVILVIGVMALSFLSANLFRYFLKKGEWKATSEDKNVNKKVKIEKTVAMRIIKARDDETGEPGPTDPLQAPKE